MSRHRGWVEEIIKGYLRKFEEKNKKQLRFLRSK